MKRLLDLGKEIGLKMFTVLALLRDNGVRGLSECGPT